MKSKFRFYAYILVFITIVFIIICSGYIISNWPIDIEHLTAVDYFIAAQFTITFIFLIAGEIRSKLIVVEIRGNQISRKNIFGSTDYRFQDFEGFETSMITSKNGTYEYLYLLQDGKRKIIISEFYHSNYDDLKEEIADKSHFLRDVDFSYLKSLREIFT